MRLGCGAGHELVHAIAGGAIAAGTAADDTASGPSGAELLNSIRAHVAAALPAYMVPEHIMVIDVIPLSPNGKVDLKRLPEPTLALPDDRETVPENGLEAKVIAAICEVTGRTQVPRMANFFDLGVTSLELVRLHRVLIETTGQRFDLLDLFEHASVQALTRHLRPPEPEAGAGPASADNPARASFGAFRRAHLELQEGGR